MSKSIEELYDQVMINDEPLALIYMWVKQNVISKKQFIQLCDRYYANRENELTEELRKQIQLDEPV